MAIAARHVPGEGTPEIHRVGAGLVNEIYRVRRAGRSFALRTAAANPCDLGVDREWEARVLENAVAADLAPAIVYIDPQRGLLISHWTPGRTWGPAELRRPANINRMAELLGRVHALPLPARPRVMHPENWIDCYSAAAAQRAAARGGASRHGVALDNDTLRDAAAAQLTALAALPSVNPVLCHSDLHSLNVMDCGPTLVVLDWEYAHSTDPLWDLAGWSANNDLEHELRQDLLAKYLGRAPARNDELRLQRLAWVYDYICLLWSELYLNLHGGSGKTPTTDAVASRARMLAARLNASK
jgi:thiamine kinase-like enzyme